MFVLLLVAVVLLLLVSVYRFKRRRLYKLAALIPGPDTQLPIIGITHTLIGNPEEVLTTLHKYVLQSMKNNGILKCWLNYSLYFIMINPEDIAVILKTCLEKDDLYRLAKDLIGSGLIIAPARIWKPHRKILAPAFKPRNIEGFINIFAKLSNNLTKNFEVRVGTGMFDAWLLLTAYTLDTVCESTMDTKIDAQINLSSPFFTLLETALCILCKRIFHVYLQAGCILRLLYPEYKQCCNALQDFTDEVIREKRKILKKEKHYQTADKNNELECYNRNCILDASIALSDAGVGLSDTDLRDELLTLAMAATDTTALTLGYTLVMLSKYPKVQEKAYKEIFNIFGSSERPPVKEDMQQLKYLEMVVKETLRLFPPVPVILRKIETELNLPSGNILPGGSGVMISIWGAHRDPKYWGPDAEHFDPERFLPERLKLQHPCSYMPFSNGPRNCVGYNYAMVAIKVALSSILRKFIILGKEESGPIPHIPVKLEITMKPVHGHEIMLEKRNYKLD